MDITLLLVLLSSTFANGLYPETWSWRRSARARSTIPSAGFYDPSTLGGSMLTQVNGTFPPGQGEPLNMIISAHSDPRVLVDSEVQGGAINFFLSLGFAGECLGQHAGGLQGANLGDGHGIADETAEKRYDYGDPQLGTCKETIQGGNHFRYWVQNGAEANSGAYFMAVSYEMPLSAGHDIVSDGYNLGRDYIVGNITQSPIPTKDLTNSSTFSGTTSFNNFTYSTQITYVSGLLQNTSIGINHNSSVPVDGRNAIDGLVAVLEVKITGSPAKSFAWRHSPPHLWQLSMIIAIAMLQTLIVS